ncbi:hypothetical protein EJ997_10515 [Flaviflexus ciconiae]|uniref:Uncharacterized protein n=1 Tax=Flaviflexus ciconiae TaxID=2496867 RepID=A0A3Q9G8U6_9ACTO|nr:hypothetical protein [Flaviflexus ciconiae]AZQ77711.1 hypothetical protein EJ997_10515 [Flaviflexus ciconiae]
MAERDGVDYIPETEDLDSPEAMARFAEALEEYERDGPNVNLSTDPNDPEWNMISPTPEQDLGPAVRIIKHPVRVVRHDGSPERYYRMKCPCGTQIRDIRVDALAEILDVLARNGIGEVSIQAVLKRLGNRS